MSIPKIIHLIWIGDNPKYIDNVLNAYKIANKDFIVKYHHFDNLHTDDTLMNYCIDVLFTFLNNNKIRTTDFIYNKLYHLFEHQWNFVFQRQLGEYYDKDSFPKKLYPLITDRYRFLLLYMEGGIYVDCDTFPLKGFDDKLLNLQQFRVLNDIYFMGCKKFMPFQYTSDYNTNIDYNVHQIPLNNNFTEQQVNDFYNGKLKYVENNTNDFQYINHYFNRSWK